MDREQQTDTEDSAPRALLPRGLLITIGIAAVLVPLLGTRLGAVEDADSDPAAELGRRHYSLAEGDPK